jgi:hypothetical protein
LTLFSAAFHAAKVEIAESTATVR